MRLDACAIPSPYILVSPHLTVASLLNRLSLRVTARPSLRWAHWKVRPKHHYLCHQLESIVETLENPLHYACFGAEDNNTV